MIVITGGLVGLNGAVDVLLEPGYNPAVGSTFLEFSPGTLSGMFTSIENARSSVLWDLVFRLQVIF